MDFDFEAKYYETITALNTLVYPTNNGNGWIIAFDKYEDVTDVINDLLDDFK